MKVWVLLAAASILGRAAHAASHDPTRAVTILVHGFDRAGADRHGVYGEESREPLAERVASLVGFPASRVTGTTYYGDTPPSYYAPADVAEIDRITAQWGGGVPRYALIVAKYARHAMERSGAQEVNFVSASFGSLVVRWLIEKNVGGLAGEGRIARWLTAEGVIGGNWAASRDGLVNFLDFLDPLPIDVQQMDYDWVNAHLHSPRTDADNPLYAGILVGQIASTDDGYNNGALTTLMSLYREYQPNDGVQALSDTYFHLFSAQSRLEGLPPTLSLFRANHRSLADHGGAWVQVAAFLTQRRRVTVAITSAQVTDLHEPQILYWNWRQAEIVFESRAYSPAVQARWGVDEALSTCTKEGAVAPLHRYRRNGETQSFTQVVFDDFVLAEETRLRVDLRAEEIDYDPHYGVYENVRRPYYDDLGSGTLLVSTVQPGTYTFRAASWNCTLAVQVFDYPFGLPPRVVEPEAQPEVVVRPVALSFSPNPHSSAVRVTLNGAAPSRFEVATLSVFDVSGREVRRITGDPSAGMDWDGRDDDGHPLPAGVYLHRVVTPRGTWFGRSCLVR